ncbi:MAG: hypothetical protein ACRCXX_13635 [Cetobacterium sp.]|uniref:hypothetical protein n=1 Tax=Cetobacterium sp. TaxID=2071632 RepID=UPI003F40B2D5
MTKLNIPIKNYNVDAPSDTTLIKDLPKAIRDKFNEAINVLLLLEESKVSSSLAESLSYFPFVKSIFVQGNGKIPDALYTKRGESWVGAGNYNYLPVVDSTTPEGKRVTIHNKTYELMFSDEIKIWAEKPEIAPELFYDFFEVSSEATFKELENHGVGDKNIRFITSNIKRFDLNFVPYICTSKNSESKTSSPLLISDTFTFTTTFNKIAREYPDGSEDVLSPDHNAVLLYVRDEYENVKIGLCYDKNNQLNYFNKAVLTPLKVYVNENDAYQLSIRLHGDKVTCFLNDKVIFETEDSLIKNKRLYFSVCSDMFYGQYANGATIFGEPMIVLNALNEKELKLLFETPRSFSFENTSDTYLDLNLNDKIILKSFIEENKRVTESTSFAKRHYLKELQLVSLYETEVAYGIADPSYRSEIKIYLEKLKLGIEESISRPSILNEYR